jgi:ligand-binding SRPBCC domain-containing protein
MAQRLQFAEWVAFPLPQVFAFFSNPENLPRLMPPETETRIERLQLAQPARPPDQNTPSLQPVAGVGSIITTSFRPFRFLPWRREWIAAITEFEWNHHFVDIQQKGPFKQWHHRHEFRPEPRAEMNGTLVRDLIEYEVGFGPLGAVANSLVIARQIGHSFAARQKMLPRLLALTDGRG